jgi:uncharacterized protein (DUF2147 family)
MRTFILTFFLLLSLSFVFAGDSFNPDSINGFWMTKDNKAKVQIWRSGQKYYGKIVFLKEPDSPDGKPKLDKHNPDEKLRTRPVNGLIILKDFVYDKDEGDYEDGTIYDPESGNEYSCYLAFQDNQNTLKVRGYIGISMLGRTEIWHRAK